MGLESKGIEGVVSEELERRAVNLVAATLAYDGYLVGAVAVLRGVGVASTLNS